MTDFNLHEFLEKFEDVKLEPNQRFDLYEYGVNKQIASNMTRKELFNFLSERGEMSSQQSIYTLIRTTTHLSLTEDGKSIAGLHRAGHFVRPVDSDLPLPPLTDTYTVRQQKSFNPNFFDLYIGSELILENVTQEEILVCPQVEQLGINPKNWRTLRETALLKDGEIYRKQYKKAYLVFTEDPDAVRTRNKVGSFAKQHLKGYLVWNENKLGDGDMIESEIVTNLASFAREHDIANTSMNTVANSFRDDGSKPMDPKKFKSHRGYQCARIAELTPNSLKQIEALRVVIPQSVKEMVEKGAEK